LEQELPTHNIREKILAYLAEQENSIAGILKRLQRDGINIHRLILTGYLNEMVESGELRERSLTPSRVFSIQIPPSKDIYFITGKVCREIDENNDGDLALSVLRFLLDRPVFFRELERCSVSFPKKFRKVTSDRRSSYLKQLASTGIVVPTNNELIDPESVNQPMLMKALREIINQSVSISGRLQGNSRMNQTTLDQ
jgi:hypothetical protein